MQTQFKLNLPHDNFGQNGFSSQHNIIFTSLARGLTLFGFQLIMYTHIYRVIALDKTFITPQNINEVYISLLLTRVSNCSILYIET